jgi:hypothetical protein
MEGARAASADAPVPLAVIHETCGTAPRTMADAPERCGITPERSAKTLTAFAAPPKPGPVARERSADKTRTGWTALERTATVTAGREETARDWGESTGRRARTSGGRAASESPEGRLW